jgi:ArsR family transcriptional regulator
MLAAARARLGDAANVELRTGVLEALPIESASLDAATMMLVLHHVPDPATALAEAYRALTPGGRLLIIDMLPHDREEYRQQMGHVWLGFSAEQIARLMEGAGFGGARVHTLPADPASRGPSLFVATGRRDSNS